MFGHQLHVAQSLTQAGIMADTRISDSSYAEILMLILPCFFYTLGQIMHFKVTLFYHFSNEGDPIASTAVAVVTRTIYGE
jgi:hypothetical protein